MKRKHFLTSILDKSADQLMAIIKEKQVAMQTMRFDLLNGKVKNVKSVMALKKEIARLNFRLSSINRAGNSVNK